MTISYADLQAANKKIKMTDIKGKKYADVSERVKAFRMVYPTGKICTEMLSNESGICVFRAEVGFVNDAGEYQMVASGMAYEKEDSSYINKTSYIENCETSAVGRALGFAGFGIDAAIRSAEEMQNALLNQSTVDPGDFVPARTRVTVIDEFCARHEITRNQFGDVYKKHIMKKIETTDSINVISPDLFEKVLQEAEMFFSAQKE